MSVDDLPVDEAAIDHRRTTINDCSITNELARAKMLWDVAASAAALTSDSSADNW